MRSSTVAVQQSFKRFAGICQRHFIAARPAVVVVLPFAEATFRELDMPLPLGEILQCCTVFSGTADPMRIHRR